jgi:hypothetical protein
LPDGQPGRAHSESSKDNNIRLNWRNHKASNYLSILIAKYGQPSHINSAPGGHVIWKTDAVTQAKFDRVVLKDRPQNYVRHYITYHVKNSQIPDVVNLTEHVEYNEFNNRLWAVGNSSEQNIAGLALATYIGQGYVSLGYVKVNKIYEQWLSDTRNPLKVDHMYDLLVFNMQHQDKEDQDSKTQK